jgi:hypothetical protein
MNPPASQERKEAAGGSAQPIEKAQFGQGDQRESKPFLLIDLAGPWLDFDGFG